jgi:hypothetical protein
LLEASLTAEIATQIETDNLLTCSDGSFAPDTGTGGHGQIIASTDKTILATRAGPDDGHPMLMSSYQSELGGLLAVLYTIYRICSYHQVTSGSIRYYCDNKGVRRNVFSRN